MNFIESIFHAAPDHGNGMLEAGIVLACFTVSLGITLFRWRRARRLLL